MKQDIDFPLPPDLPGPADDGAADHLAGMEIPELRLRSTYGGTVDLSHQRAPRTVVYCFPLIDIPGKPLPEGWNGILGTTSAPEARNFQEHYGEFLELNVEVFGLSTQTHEYQREMTSRLHLPYEILSDEEFKLSDALRLPTIEVNGMRLLKHLTLVIRGGRIEHTFYPVVSPDRSAEQVVQWLNDHPVD